MFVYVVIFVLWRHSKAVPSGIYGRHSEHDFQNVEQNTSEGEFMLIIVLQLISFLICLFSASVASGFCGPYTIYNSDVTTLLRVNAYRDTRSMRYCAAQKQRIYCQFSSIRIEYCELVRCSSSFSFSIEVLLLLNSNTKIQTQTNTHLLHIKCTLHSQSKSAH